MNCWELILKMFPKKLTRILVLRLLPIADSLWESFQEKTNQFINSNGGVSSINTPITNRPNWNKVKEILEGSKPISDLGCN